MTDRRNFYTPVTPSQRDERQRKEIKNKETETTPIMLQSIKKGTEDMEEQSTKREVKKLQKDK